MLETTFGGVDNSLGPAFNLPPNLCCGGMTFPMMLSALSCSETYRLCVLGETCSALPPLLTRAQGNPVDLEGACGPAVWDLINTRDRGGSSAKKELVWLQAGLAHEMFSVKHQHPDVPVVVPKGPFYRSPNSGPSFKMAWTGKTSFHDTTAEEAVEILEEWHAARGNEDENWNKGLRVTCAVAFRAAVVQAHLCLCIGEFMMGLQLSRWAIGFIEGCNQRLSPHLSQSKALAGGCLWYTPAARAARAATEADLNDLHNVRGCSFTPSLMRIPYMQASAANSSLRKKAGGGMYDARGGGRAFVNANNQFPKGLNILMGLKTIESILGNLGTIGNGERSTPWLKLTCVDFNLSKTTADLALTLSHLRALSPADGLLLTVIATRKRDSQRRRRTRLPIAALLAAHEGRTGRVPRLLRQMRDNTRRGPCHLPCQPREVRPAVAWHQPAVARFLSHRWPGLWLARNQVRPGRVLRRPVRRRGRSLRVCGRGAARGHPGKGALLLGRGGQHDPLLPRAPVGQRPLVLRHWRRRGGGSAVAVPSLRLWQCGG